MFSRQWDAGEHVFISAKTGTGKTDLMLELMQRFRHAAILCCKPDDPIFQDERAREYRVTETWNPTSLDRKLMVMPSEKNRDTQEAIAEQRYIHKTALEAIYKSRGYAIGLDELYWMSNDLRLKRESGRLAFMGRSKGITLVAATQRPVNIDPIVMQNISYAFVSRAMRESDLKGLSELGTDYKTMVAAIRSIKGKHDFLFVDTTGEIPLQIVNTHA
jgi:hypothetical protein